MWLIEVNKNGTKESHIWHNKHTDDFARFIPGQFGVTKEDCKFYHITKQDCDTYCDLMAQLDGEQNPLHQVDNSIDGKMIVKQVSDNATVFELTGDQKLWSSMYDQDMKFILNSNQS